MSALDSWAADEHVTKNVLTLMDGTFIRREPLGVVLVMGAWNYPVQLCFAPMIGAISAGNAVIVKPSELCPNVANAIKRVLEDKSTGLDTDAIQVVTGGIPETTALLKNKFDYIFFTGSARIGRIISEAAAKHLTPITLELGGKSPAFVDSGLGDTQMERAVKRILWGKMVCLGQTCVAPDYILCDERTKDRMIALFKKHLAEFFGEDPEKSDDLSRIVNERNFERIVSMLDNTNGIKEIEGERGKNYIGFTAVVFDGSSSMENDPLMKEEIFGPVLPIVVLKNGREEAVEVIRRFEKPLSLYIFSERSATTEYILENTSSGSVCVNDVIVQLSVDTLPFGGVGESGHGAYHGMYSHRTFSHDKSVLVRDLGAFGELLGLARYPPYSEKKMKILSNLIKSRNLPPIKTWLTYMTVFCAGAASFAGYIFAAREHNLYLPEFLQ